ncbi:O-methyltransferase family 2 [Macrophomina phaseolina MS6]|uniref:O-methyltransferase family 2 n=1 Tax=Macrophomina phaseolina (strain MS6) TaxID=1126212 RepID=K2S4I5_MACPH|nr:O-methyltransferase family 2 [Macrophomina phaseolina MS6]
MMTPDIFDTVCFMSDETQVTATFMLDALEKWPGSQEPNHTAFNLSRNTTDVFYSYLEKHPERARRAGGAFRAMNKHTLSGPADFTSSRLWQDLDVPGKLLVDVGGNMGHVSQQTAKDTKNLSFLIEDLPDTCIFGENELAAEFHGRITCKPHDFFQDQPIKGADVYFMRMILHDWPDKYCIRILEKLVPALKDGSKVVCCEVILPETASPTCTDRCLRRMDLTMLAIHNATERTETQWRQLFARVDPRFTLEFESWPHTLHGLVIATWHA